jgi:hypothetical protein
MAKVDEEGNILDERNVPVKPSSSDDPDLKALKIEKAKLDIDDKRKRNILKTLSVTHPQKFAYDQLTGGFKSNVPNDEFVRAYSEAYKKAYKTLPPEMEEDVATPRPAAQSTARKPLSSFQK